MPVNGQEHLHADERRSPEHLRHERLVALLRDVAETRGKVKAAEALGVSFRTLARAVESGRLTGRMADALERHLLEVEGSVTAPVRQKQADGLEGRMEQLEADVAEAARSASTPCRRSSGRCRRTRLGRYGSGKAGWLGWKRERS